MRKVISILLVLVMMFSFAGCGEASEEQYPSKTISIYVGAKAGGGTDKLVRLIAPLLEEELGESVVVVNKSGAAGHLSNLEVLNSEPNAYTLGVLTDFETIGNLMGGDLGYEKDDFNMIGSVNANTNALIVGADFPGEKTLEGFIEYAKANPKKIIVGTTSAAQQMVLASFMAEAGVEVTPVLYSGGPDSYNNLLGGHVDAVVISPSFVEQSELEGCKAIAVASHEKFSLLEDVPTFKEKGYDVINNELTRIFFAPKDTPQELIDILEAALEKVTNTEEFREQLLTINEMYSYKNAEEARESFDAKFNSVSEIVKENPDIIK